jgi:hypothetical protein
MSTDCEVTSGNIQRTEENITPSQYRRLQYCNSSLSILRSSYVSNRIWRPMLGVPKSESRLWCYKRRQDREIVPSFLTEKEPIMMP